MRYNEIIYETTSKWRLVPIDDLPIETVDDICAIIAEKCPIFSDDPDPQFVKDNLIGLVEPPKVWLGMESTQSLLKTMQRNNSDFVVTKYTKTLSDNIFEFDPIITAHGRFVDGGHRLEAYAKAGREYIPVVDIGHILNAPPNVWEDWMDGVKSTRFDPGSR